MKKNILLFSLLIIFISCNKDSSLSKKIPGWYTCEQNMVNGTLSGNMTFYKNGEMKLIANFKGKLFQNSALGVAFTMMGTWKIEKGYLKHEISKVTSSPQFLGDVLFEAIKKEENGSPGDKIIHVDAEALQVKTPKGETITYKRIQQ